MAEPPLQDPPWQVSAPLQTSPSRQALPSASAAFTQPATSSQLSSVQLLLSSQPGGRPPTQDPAVQVSFVVQALPSSQDKLLSLFTQPLNGSQISSVQPLSSLQSTNPGTNWQPTAAAQLSVVQALESSQVVGPPLTQTPTAHWSPLVQGSPSLQAALLVRLRQPLIGSQILSVQTLPSLQSRAVPSQTPAALQASSVVQTLASLQALTSAVQSAAQQSPAMLFPSSQVSPASTIPLPHSAPNTIDAPRVFTGIAAPLVSETTTLEKERSMVCPAAPPVIVKGISATLTPPPGEARLIRLNPATATWAVPVLTKGAPENSSVVPPTHVPAESRSGDQEIVAE